MEVIKETEKGKKKDRKKKTRSLKKKQKGRQIL